jgi:two-component system response regulator PilR (NtrC family)
MESEFFGHIKGSFTGATSNKQGLFEAANGGTLFLDEIADLPLTMQVKLLRAIQERRIRPIGSHSEIDVDVRLLSASHKNLTALVDAGEFRADLFYRLNVIGIEVPALHQRIEDIPLLVKHILKKLSAEHISLTDSALSALCQYAFPGNIRELENILERATTMLDGNVIQADDLKLNSQKKNQQSDSPQNSQDTSFIDLEKHLETIERKLINDALEATRWNRTAAASRLGLSFRSLRYRLKKLGIE